MNPWRMQGETSRSLLLARFREVRDVATGLPTMLVSLLWERSREVKDGDHSGTRGRSTSSLKDRLRWRREGNLSRLGGIVARLLH